MLNDYRRINFFKDSKVYKIQDKVDRFDLKVTFPYGEDRIVVYASDLPLGNVTMEPMSRGLNQYRGSQKSLATMTRGISVVLANGENPSGAQFYEAMWTLRTGR